MADNSIIDNGKENFFVKTAAIIGIAMVAPKRVRADSWLASEPKLQKVTPTKRKAAARTRAFSVSSTTLTEPYIF